MAGSASGSPDLEDSRGPGFRFSHRGDGCPMTEKGNSNWTFFPDFSSYIFSRSSLCDILCSVGLNPRASLQQMIQKFNK